MNAFTRLTFLWLGCCLAIAKFSVPALHTLVSDEHGQFIASRCIKLIVLDKVRRQDNSKYIHLMTARFKKKIHTSGLIYRLFNLALGRALEKFWYVLLIFVFVFVSLNDIKLYFSVQVLTDFVLREGISGCFSATPTPNLCNALMLYIERLLI